MYINLRIGIFIEHQLSDHLKGNQNVDRLEKCQHNDHLE
jgi:hypothetical protein